jgi:hypothetical protein
MWTLLCLLFAAAGLVLASERDIRISAVVMWISICTTGMDWSFGWVRVLRSLPFTAGQIGRVYWWLTVCAPTLLFAVFSAVGILIARLAATHGETLGTWLQMFIAPGPQDKFLGLWLETVLAGGLLSGSFFWFVSVAVWASVLTRPGKTRRESFLRQFAACAFVIALVAGIYFLCKSSISSTDKLVVAYFFGFVFSVLGWIRAKRLFIESSFRPDIARAGLTRGKSEPRPGYGGALYLIVRFCVFYLGIVALVIALVIGAYGIAVRVDHGAHWSDIVSPGLGELQFWIFLMCLIQTMIMGTHLKFLRSLPLTSKQLAATILCVAILPVLIIGGLWSSFFLIEPGFLSAVSILKFCLLNLAPVCALTTGVIWYNEKHFRRITGVILAWNVSLVPIIYQMATASRGGLPIWIIIAIPVVSVFMAWLTINRLLERNDMTYRLKWEMLGHRP